jgi:hypothetical protein
MVLNVTPPALVSVRVTPVNPSIESGPGRSQQFTATGATADGVTLDVTNYVTWSSSALAVAFVNLAGLATVNGPGTATIRAVSGAVSDSTTLTVTPPVLVSIQLSFNPIFLLTQSPQLFRARGIYSNGTAAALSVDSVVWTSSNPAVAPIEATGLATFLTPGSTVLTATSAGVSASTTLTIVPQGFFPTGSMTIQRFSHTATLLSDGRVLLAGGRDYSNTILRTLEAYNPATQTFSAAGFMAAPRQQHTATLLNNGKILIAGGLPFLIHPPIATATAELLDSSTGLSAPIGGMAYARMQHTATLLGNGKTLIVGGSSDGAGGVSVAELYDPATGLFTPTGSLLIARFQHTATPLNNGRVLISGGTNDGFNAVGLAEIYDPATGAFSFLTNLPPRLRHSATLLNSGKVLVAGGVSTLLQNVSTYLSADLFDPNGLYSVKTMLGPHQQHTGTLLADGRVLVAGGTNFAAELYDPVTDQFKALGNTLDIRSEHTATRLANGDVLIAGGSPGPTADLYRPSPGQ